MKNNSRQMVVVLGAGRSGTSLLMQILVGLGVKVSENLIPANISNPEGFFEDADIKEIHAELISKLGSFAYLPLPDDWMSSSLARDALLKLKEALEANLNTIDGIFALKDPRINMLLPLWTRIFNQLKIVPRFILAVRTPSYVISSMIHQYNYTVGIAELVWLTRTVEALEYTMADCFIVHYEDWFADPEPLAQAVIRYTGLNENKNNLSDVLAKTVKSNLNRASHDSYEIQNPFVHKLYNALKECHSADFNREKLMAVVKECRQAMDGFKSWYQLAYQANKKFVDIQSRLEKVTMEATKVPSLELRIRGLEREKVQSSQLITQVQKLEQQLEQLIMI